MLLGLDLGSALIVLLIKPFPAPEDFITGSLKEFEPWVDEPVEPVQCLQVLSFLHSLLGQLLLGFDRCEFLRCLDVLFVVVQGTALLEDVLHELLVCDFFLSESLTLLI